MSERENWFGRYRLLRRISVGGMAEVWHAKSYSGQVFEKEVALKRILPHIAEDENLLAMFIEEARLAARLDHPNVSHIYELGRTLTSYYLTMEYIYGEDLRSVQKQMNRSGKQASPAFVAEVGLGVARGLAHAHGITDADGKRLNLVHRDVSPQNVMVSFSGEVKLIDFGIAKASGRALETQAGVLKGKLGYMAPEQLERVELDGRVDQFSLGIILWETLAGKRLFTGPSPIAAIEMVRKCEVPDLREIRPDCPEELVLLLEKMLQRNRDDRFRTSTDLVIGLEEVVAQHWSSMNGDELLRVELSALFPEAGELKLTEHEVKTLFSAEERGEAVTDPRVVDDATEIFIPDTTRIDIYRKQIEALLEARRTGVTPVPGVEAVENVKEKRAGLGGLDSTWRAILVEGMVVLITLGILGFFALAAWIHR